MFQVVHGGKEAVEAICDHPGIAAISFVGSTKIAKIVYRRATANSQALPRARRREESPHRHARRGPRDDVEQRRRVDVGMRRPALHGGVGDGRRVEDRSHHRADGRARAKTIVPGKDIGPVISAAAKERIERYIAEAEAAGAKVLVDGRDAVVQGKESGYFIGPTIIDHVTPDMRIAQEEVFGPVLVIVRTKNVDEAIAVENASPYGNAASVFTESGGIARYVMEHASAGMVGVNVGVPVPREPFSFGGWNDSKFGVGDITGRGSIEFWTQAKKMTTKWNQGSRRRTGCQLKRGVAVDALSSCCMRQFGGNNGVDRSVTFTGIKFENPFLLSSAPPTESESNILRAFDAGWGGVVTKTIGLHPVVNVVRREGEVHAHDAGRRARVDEEAAGRGAALVVELGAHLRQDARLVGAAHPAHQGSVSEQAC